MFLTAKAGLLLLSVTAHARSIENEDLPLLSRFRRGHAHRGNADQPVQSIFGGDPMIPGSRPYLLVTGSYFWGPYCAGSLISPHAVMTYASCLFAYTRGTLFWDPPEWVDVNRYSLSNDTGVRRISLADTNQCTGDAVTHPEFDYLSTSYDVAILFLPTPVNDVTPVHLNLDSRIPATGDEAVVLDFAGWGPNENYTFGEPRNITLDPISNEECTKKPYRNREEWITETTMCAASFDSGNQSPCNGDKGAPLVLGKIGGGPLLPPVQVGISIGIWRCGDYRYPGVYTRVSEVADWVKGTVCERTGELCLNSKASKQAKVDKASKSLESKCSKYPVLEDKYFPTYSPTASPVPTTAWPTWVPSGSNNH